jgi:hypothetical protein
MVDFVLMDDQNVDCAVTAIDDAGNAVPGTVLDAGSVTASAADAGMLTVTVSADGSSVNVRANGPEGTGNVVTVNGTLGGSPLTGSLTFDVTNSPPTGLGLTPGTPVHN